ncbi:MAG: GTPase ObgE [Deltaproteobacteria bacterium]|nr:GTPase ObgE [Deltaproteobacteria bacterium]
MRFIDEAKIFVKAGDGGNGSHAFRREAHEPRGGPSGGDGGRGGSVYLVADPQASTLADFRYRREFKAPRGEHGRGKDQYGRSGEDVEIKVPLGTLVKDEEGFLIVDMSQAGQRFEIAKGGRGGRGNIHFTTPTNRAPRRSDPGEPGEEKTIFFELKLLADVGLVGRPNAGKSTFLSRISNAKPKIADYPFTTLSPVLGVVEPKDLPHFTVADIPGLIEGAHEGAGLGHEFLRHIERNRVLLHLIDVSNPEEDPWEAYEEIRKELLTYDKALSKKPEWVVFTKMEVNTDKKILQRHQKFFEKKKKKVFLISSVTGEGLKDLIEKLGVFLARKNFSRLLPDFRSTD